MRVPRWGWGECPPQVSHQPLDLTRTPVLISPLFEHQPNYLKVEHPPMERRNQKPREAHQTHPRTQRPSPSQRPSRRPAAQVTGAISSPHGSRGPFPDPHPGDGRSIDSMRQVRLQAQPTLRSHSGEPPSQRYAHSTRIYEPHCWAGWGPLHPRPRLHRRSLGVPHQPATEVELRSHPSEWSKRSLRTKAPHQPRLLQQRHVGFRRLASRSCPSESRPFHRQPPPNKPNPNPTIE